MDNFLKLYGEAAATTLGLFWMAFGPLGLWSGLSNQCDNSGFCHPKTDETIHGGHGPEIGCLGYIFWIVMEWAMVWKDVTVGFTIAGIIAAFVPTSFFQALFIGSGSSDPTFWEILAQCIIGPVAAQGSGFMNSDRLTEKILFWHAMLAYLWLIGGLAVQFIINKFKPTLVPSAPYRPFHFGTERHGRQRQFADLRAYCYYRRPHTLQNYSNIR